MSLLAAHLRGGGSAPGGRRLMACAPAKGAAADDQRSVSPSVTVRVTPARRARRVWLAVGLGLERGGHRQRRGRPAARRRGPRTSVDVPTRPAVRRAEAVPDLPIMAPADRATRTTTVARVSASDTGGVAARGSGTFPSGLVTFVFTDIEASTQLLRRIGDRYPPLLERHCEILRVGVDVVGRVRGEDGRRLVLRRVRRPDGRHRSLRAGAT